MKNCENAFFDHEIREGQRGKRTLIILMADKAVENSHIKA